MWVSPFRQSSTPSARFRISWERFRSSGSRTCRGYPRPETAATAHAHLPPPCTRQVEIDYQLSQVGRGLKYSSDPTLLLKDPTLPDGELIKGAGNALIVSEKGDARLLEIGGTASAAVIEYVRTLRELALESIHGNRASPDKVAAAQSGRALELLNQGLIWLADNLRTSYGEVGLLQLARLIVRASQMYTSVCVWRGDWSFGSWSAAQPQMAAMVSDDGR